MDITQWLAEQEQDLLCHLEDSLRNGDFDMIEHVTEGCQCEGKRCSQCEQVKCRGMFSPNGKNYLRSNCKLCKQASDKKRWHDNAETLNARRKEQRPLRADKINASHRASRAIHGHKYNQRRREKSISDPEYAESRRVSCRTARLKNGSVYNAKKRSPAYREKARKWDRKRDQENENRITYKRTYRVEHPEQFHAYDTVKHHKRRANKTQAGGSFTVLEWRGLKAYYDFTCLCCGRREPEIKLTADHVIPVVKHGTSNIENIQPLCVSCNSRKHDKIIDYRRRKAS